MESVDLDAKYNIADTDTPLGEQLTAHYKKSYAFYTFTHRVPVILTNILDRLTKDKDEIAQKYDGSATKEELKKILGEISKLKYELQTDKKMLEIPGDDSDQKDWNQLLADIEPNCSYFSAKWLYAECYIYRRLRSIFEQTTLRNFDHFEYSKQREFNNSLNAVAAVLNRVNEFNLEKSSKSQEEIGKFFRRLLKLNLWGNRNDLSVSLGVEIANENDSNPIEDIESFNEFLVVDQTHDIWRCISDSNKKNGIVDIINDNSAYELMCDFILADFILEHNLAETIRFHVKAIPWFISDVTPVDFYWSLDQLKSSSNEILRKTGQKWEKYVTDKKFVLIEPPSHFWTSGLEFHRMESVNPNLYNLISESHLAIFKGDLNYRKLLGDVNWDTTTDFSTVLQGFSPTNLCTLRTVKADLVCGMLPGQAEKLKETDSKWMETGKYGVIQFAPK